ncbi:MAG TPA: aminoglycoside phosphotransferase family protein [Xanthobacteraceae bacterium]|nr:aminoglycoside phosphotransferase family protein [Xanthobacteraceae bacterium]
MFIEYLGRWGLTPDGHPILSRNSHLLPVRWRGATAMLKVALEAEEEVGGALMEWWGGEGAARVLAIERNAILLERAQGKASLADFARHGRDDEASRIICAVVTKLHAPRTEPPPYLVPLQRWFRELKPAAAAHGGILAASAATARELLAAHREVVALHGDIHHGNILDFGERGWLAIDPKGLIGERGFDYANLFCNPDYETASAPGRLACQIEVVAGTARLERRRLLEWVLAWAGLSAAWHMGDGTPPETALLVAEIAAAQLSV